MSEIIDDAPEDLAKEAKNEDTWYFVDESIKERLGDGDGPSFSVASLFSSRAEVFSKPEEPPEDAQTPTVPGSATFWKKDSFFILNPDDSRIDGVGRFFDARLTDVRTNDLPKRRREISLIVQSKFKRIERNQQRFKTGPSRCLGPRMPRTYIKKKPPPSYSVEDLKNAVFDVLNQVKNYREAEEAYGVPISVIYHRIKGRQCSSSKIGAGRPTALPNDVEIVLAKCLIARSRMGFPCHKEELKSLIREYVEVNGLQTPFKGNQPGDDWYQGFMRRNPNLSLKKPEHLQKARKHARDPFVIFEFFDAVKLLYSDNSVDSPCMVFNADESGFANDPSRLRAIGEKGVALNRVSDGSGRDSTTVLACVSASGCALPPLIVHKGQAVQPRWVSDEAYPGTDYAATNNGWMEEPTFYFWFTKMFLPFVEETRGNKNLPGKVAVLFYDGHASHMSIRIIEKAMENNVQLVKFPSHLTDKLQPLDKCVFGPVKMAWEKVLVEHGKTKMGQGPSRLSKSDFARLLNKAWMTISSKNIVSGFVSTGIFPLDENKIPEELFDPRDLSRYKNRKTTIQRLRDVQGSNADDFPPAPIQSEDERRSEIVPFNDDPDQSDECVILDLSIPRTDRELVEENDTGVTDMVAIFSRSISKNSASTLSASPVKKTGTRLKHQTYGEVLTREEVLSRLKEAEENKNKPRKRKPRERRQVEDEQKSGRETKARKKTSKKTEEDIESEEEELLNEMIADDTADDSVEDFETYAQKMEDEEVEELELEEPTMEDIKPSKFVLVDIEGGRRMKSHYLYVCRVDVVTMNDIEVTGLKSVDRRKTKFILVEKDKFSVEKSRVKAVLPSPLSRTEGRKEIFEFPGRINVREF